MSILISLLIEFVIFILIGYLAFWICDKAGFPPPVKWIVGLVLLLVLLVAVAGWYGPIGLVPAGPLFRTR